MLATWPPGLWEIRVCSSKPLSLWPSLGSQEPGTEAPVSIPVPSASDGSFHFHHAEASTLRPASPDPSLRSQEDHTPPGHWQAVSPTDMSTSMWSERQGPEPMVPSWRDPRLLLPMAVGPRIRGPSATSTAPTLGGWELQFRAEVKAQVSGHSLWQRIRQPSIVSPMDKEPGSPASHVPLGRGTPQASWQSPYKLWDQTRAWTTQHEAARGLLSARKTHLSWGVKVSVTNAVTWQQHH